MRIQGAAQEMEWDNRPQSSLAQRGRGRVPPGAVPWHRLIPLTEHERSQTYANITSLNLHSSGISCYIQEVVLTYVPRRLNKCLLPHFIPPSTHWQKSSKGSACAASLCASSWKFLSGKKMAQQNNVEVNLGYLRGCCCL